MPVEDISRSQDAVLAEPVEQSLMQTLLSPSHSGFQQMIRFGLAGGVATVADLAALWCLLHLMSLPAAVAGGYAVGIVVSYVLSVWWVFPHRNIKDKRWEFIVFAIIGVIALALTEAIVIAGVNVLGMEVMPAKFVSIVLVFFFNFGARKVIMFRSPE